MEVGVSFRSGALAASLLGGSLLVALPALAASRGDGCFLANDWQGWKSPSPNVIYIRVRPNDVYRLDL